MLHLILRSTGLQASIAPRTCVTNTRLLLSQLLIPSSQSNTPYDSASRKMGGTMVAGTALGNRVRCMSSAVRPLPDVTIIRSSRSQQTLSDSVPSHMRAATQRPMTLCITLVPTMMTSTYFPLVASPMSDACWYFVLLSLVSCEHNSSAAGHSSYLLAVLDTLYSPTSTNEIIQRAAQTLSQTTLAW